jgi:cation transport regulator ChaB
MAELPPALRRELPTEAQRLYRATYREALDAGAGEDDARAAAQEAVEERFRKLGNRWEPKDEPTSGPPYGEAAIAALAREVRFPCTSAQFAQQASKATVELAAGQPMPLAEVLDLVEGYYWREPKELLEALHAAWPRVRRRWDERHAEREVVPPR